MTLKKSNKSEKKNEKLRGKEKNRHGKFTKLNSFPVYQIK